MFVSNKRTKDAFLVLKTNHVAYFNVVETKCQFQSNGCCFIRNSINFTLRNAKHSFEFVRNRSVTFGNKSHLEENENKSNSSIFV